MSLQLAKWPLCWEHEDAGSVECSVHNDEWWELTLGRWGRGQSPKGSLERQNGLSFHCGPPLSSNTPPFLCSPLTQKPILTDMLHLCLQSSLHSSLSQEPAFPYQPSFPPNPPESRMPQFLFLGDSRKVWSPGVLAS